MSVHVHGIDVALLQADGESEEKEKHENRNNSYNRLNWNFFHLLGESARILRTNDSIQPLHVSESYGNRSNRGEGSKRKNEKSEVKKQQYYCSYYWLKEWMFRKPWGKHYFKSYFENFNCFSSCFLEWMDSEERRDGNGYNRIESELNKVSKLWALKKKKRRRKLIFFYRIVFYPFWSIMILFYASHSIKYQK